ASTMPPTGWWRPWSSARRTARRRAAQACPARATPARSRAGVEHGNAHVVVACRGARLLVSRVRMTHHAAGGVVGEHEVAALCGELRAVDAHLRARVN